MTRKNEYADIERRIREKRSREAILAIGIIAVIVLVAAVCG